MLQRSTLLHLRIPFSFYLSPVYLFALSLAGAQLLTLEAVIVFLVWHLFVYPASNGFNSYYDRDEESIGGLATPPPVSGELLRIALLFDLLGLLLALLVSTHFALAVLVYGLASKAYSHPLVRLKKYPILSLLVIAVFQGAWVFAASYQALTGVQWAAFAEAKLWLPALLTSVMLLGSYPMTQVYQHGEDARRGDLTFSRLLGVRGTFYYTAAVFALVMPGFAYYYDLYYSRHYSVMFFMFLMPTLLYFLHWLRKVRGNVRFANYRYTMRLNTVSSVCLVLFYLFFYLANR